MICPPIYPAYRDNLDGRFMIVRKLDMVPVECVVRGYLVGSGYKEYKESGTVCGLQLPEGMSLAEKLEQPIFTPARKATDGHDENISFEAMVEMVGADLAESLRARSIDIYRRAADYARSKGVLIADTKFEFGLLDNQIVLADEVLTRTPAATGLWILPNRKKPT